MSSVCDMRLYYAYIRLESYCVYRLVLVRLALAFARRASAQSEPDVLVTPCVDFTSFQLFIVTYFTVFAIFFLFPF